MAEIVLDRVSKRYPNGALALKETSLTIRDGEFFILVGPSGCGKSTLLNMIVGLEEVTEGEIRVDGKTINEVDPKDRNMAMVFQSYALYPHMTVRENLAFPLKLAKLPKDEIARRVGSTAEMLQLTDLLDRKPANLSGGQRQRVAMGRAIVRSPAVYLMDEPMSNLDARLRVEMRAEIARLQRRLGVTTVYVTHDQTEAMTLGDRVAVLREGAVQQIGTPRELYHDPSNLFVAGFIGSPAMNFMPAELHDHRLHLPITDFQLPEELRMRFPANRGGLTAGIRPEHVQDAAIAHADLGYGPIFQARVDVLEWLGADQYVHVTIDDLSRMESWKWLHDRQPELLPGGGFRMLVRLDPDSSVRTGGTLDLWFDARRLYLFDAATGENLVRPQI